MNSVTAYLTCRRFCPWMPASAVKPESQPAGSGRGKADLAARHPFSFLYNGKTSDDLLALWPRERKSEQLDSDRTRITTTWADPATGLPVAEDATMNMESTVAVTGQQSMTIPSSQSVTTHRSLVPNKQ